MSLPHADDLFRPTDDEEAAEATAARRGSVRAVPNEGEPAEAPTKAASGRVRHDEKMTVYVTPQELIDLEQARLTLRGAHGLAVDRGRLVREALAVVLHDLDENGAASMLVRRLAEE